MWSTIAWLFLALTGPLSETAAPWESAGFTKRLSDGSTATLEFCKWAERTTRVFIAQDKDCQDERLFTETLYRYRMTIERDGAKETVWEKMVTIGPAMAGCYPDFSVKDVEIIDDRLYILYAFADGYLNLVVYEKKESGPWVYLVCWRLDDRPRWMDECRITNDAGRPCVVCLDTRTRASHEERWDIHWNADGTGTLRLNSSSTPQPTRPPSN